MPVEYGVPTAHFIMKGTVTDEAGTPIQGIKATLKVMPYQQPEHAYGIDSTMTDAAGKYQIEYHQLLNEKILLLEDVDGAANGGEFQSDTIDISKLEPKKIGEGDGREVFRCHAVRCLGNLCDGIENSDKILMLCGCERNFSTVIEMQ